MQLLELKKDFDRLQLIYGEPTLNSIYGAGCIKNPDAMFVFMNPTGKNISSLPGWQGLRAPWLGTKNIWGLFFKLGFLSEGYFERTQQLKGHDWNMKFATLIYRELAKRKIYVTNLAKCTQLDARPLQNLVFTDYLDLMFKEILAIQPKNIIAFGNQVSSILLAKQVSVSKYKNTQKEVLKIHGQKFNIYPTYYPVGQGRRNMPLAIKRIRAIL
jgi:uracil-DNA glycosylase